jgi:hypothetical protein
MWKGKHFFFEKKKQKTFISSLLPKKRQNWDGAYLQDQKFFGSFFQKRTACLLPSCPP